MTDQTLTYYLPASRVEDFRERVTQANERLDKHGIPGQWTIDKIKESDVPVTIDGERFIHRQAAVTLSAPQATLDGWRPVAEVTFTPSGNPVVRHAYGHTGPAPDLDQDVCDVCHARRARSLLYVFTDEEGQTAQVGSTCVEAFTGITPTGIQTVFDTSIFGDTYQPSRARDGVEHRDDVLLAAIRVTDGGKVHISRERAELSLTPSTSADVRQMLREAFDQATPDEEALIEQIRSFIDDIEDEDDTFLGKLRAVASDEWVAPRDIGLLAYAPVAFWRDQEKRRREQVRASINDDWRGSPGDKIANGTTFTVQRTSRHSTMWGMTTIVSMLDDANRQITWFASGSRDFRKGQVLTATSGVIKDHDMFDGKKNTVVSRLRLASSV